MKPDEIKAIRHDHRNCRELTNQCTTCDWLDVIDAEKQKNAELIQTVKDQGQKIIEQHKKYSGFGEMMIENGELQYERLKLRRLLKKHQHGSMIMSVDGSWTYDICPECKLSKPEGHSESCALSAAVGEPEKETVQE